ncbi:glutamate-rich protein 3 isoform X2 [Festucalex cinctus]
MSHFNPGLIAAYNSLTDKHLTGYFSSTRMRRRLQRAGLITRSGRIVPDKEYKHKLLQRAHQRHVRECLAQAIFLKVLEMERVHQMEIKRKLEEFARRERVHKMKVARTKRVEEDVQMTSPRPPMGARAVRKQHSGPVGGHYGSSESPCSSRPNTAPGKMQRPARLKPIHSGNDERSTRRGANEAFRDEHPPFDCTMDRKSRRHEPTAWDPPPGVSPYYLPVINNFVTPMPPATKRKSRGPGCGPSGSPSLRGRRRLRPATTSAAIDANEEQPLLRTSARQSKVHITMVYFGKSVHLSHDSEDLRDEVKVFQQHCGGENLCVYKGKLREGEMFQFASRRHRGFPFSLTFFLNGLQVERLSSCCEFKHRRGPRLGGRHGHFGFSAVERASPCYKCIIAMGLDRKPAPPPKKVQDAGGSLEEARSASHSGRESTSEHQEGKSRDDYEEDFEADDTVVVEESSEKKASSPTSGNDAQTKDDISSDSEDDNKDGGFAAEDDTRPRSSSSSCEESDIEVVEGSKEDEEEAEEPKEILQEETADEKGQVNVEEAAATESSTKVDVSDTGEEELSQEASGENIEDQEAEDGRKSEEPERAKSVQEKLVEAILQESHRSSEPELSDTSTEEEEVASTDQGHKPKKDAVLVESKLEEASEPKDHAEAGQDEPYENSDDSKDESLTAIEQQEVKEAKDGADLEAEMKTLEPQDEASAISIDKTIGDADSEVKPASETPETKEEETTGGSELVATPEESSGLLEATVSKEANIKDEGNRVQEVDDALGDTEATREGRDDPVVKCEEHSKEEEEETNTHEKPSDSNEGTVKDARQTEESHKTIENTAEGAKDETQTNKEEAVASLKEDDADESEKTETDKGEGLNLKSTEAAEVHEEKEDEVNETNTDNKDKNEVRGNGEKGTEESTAMADKDEAIPAQTEEGEDMEKATSDNMEESKDAPDKDEEEKIVNAEDEEIEEINKASTDDKEESKVVVKVDNETEEIEGLTNKNEEKIVISQMKEGEERDKATTENKERTEATEDENIAEESKNEIDKDEEQKTADSHSQGEELRKATDKVESEAREKYKREDEGKDVSDKDEEIVTVHTDDGEEIKKPTTDNLDKSEVRHKDEDEPDKRKNVTGKDEHKEIITAETAIVDQIDKSTVDKTEESEHNDENNAKKSKTTEVDPEEEMIVTSDTEETSKIAQEAENASEEHLQNADKKINVMQNVGGFQVANVRRTTQETTADKVLTIENGKVDAENGEMSIQAGSISNEYNSDANTSEQIEKGRQPDDEPAEHTSLEGKMERTGDFHQVDGGADVECDKDDFETLLLRVDLNEVEKPKETPKNQADPSSVVGASAEKFSKDQQSSKPPGQNVVSKTRCGTEEASKTSEEGASVLLQPQTESKTPSVDQHPHGESPEALARASSTELVNNWLTTHQASKFFETFVEPLEDLKDSDVGASKEARQSSELLKMVDTSHKEVALSNGKVAQSYPERHPIKDNWEASNEKVEDDAKPNIKNEPKLIEKDESKRSLIEDEAESTGIKPQTAAQIVENGSRLDVGPTSTEKGFPGNDTHPAYEKDKARTSPEGQDATEASSSDIGNHVGVEDKPSVNRDMRLMDDIGGKSRLRVNKMPFASSSYSLLASARTGSGH